MKAKVSVDLSMEELYKLLSRATDRKVTAFRYHRAMDQRESTYCTIEYEEKVPVDWTADES
jgi:hypothetical protein